MTVIVPYNFLEFLKYSTEGTAKNIPKAINNCIIGKTAPPIFKFIDFCPYNLIYETI